MLFRSQILSQFNNASTVWDFCDVSDIWKTEKVQGNSLRIVYSHQNDFSSSYSKLLVKFPGIFVPLLQFQVYTIPIFFYLANDQAEYQDPWASCLLPLTSLPFTLLDLHRLSNHRLLPFLFLFCTFLSSDLEAAHILCQWELYPISTSSISSRTDLSTLWSPRTMALKESAAVSCY